MYRSFFRLITLLIKSLCRSVAVLPVLHISLLTVCFSSALAQTYDLEELKQRKDTFEKKTVSLPAVQAKIEYQIRLEPKSADLISCQVGAAVSYSQFGDRARVDSVIDNRDCAASSGEYTVRLRIRDANSEVQLIEHVESWARDDDVAVETQKFYDIGSNVDLIRVNTADLTCVCDKAERINGPAMEGEDSALNE